MSSLHISDDLSNLITNMITTTTLDMLLNKIYPVGSIYMSINNISPATFLGGTWELITDKFLIGAGNNYSVNSTGGNKTIDISHAHPLSANGGARIGCVSGKMYYNRGWVGTNITYNQTITNYNPDHTNNGAYNGNVVSTLTGNTDSAGSNSVDITPPYLAVYMWKRTA